MRSSTFKYSLVLSLFLVISLNCLADLGNSLVYQVRIELNNNSHLTGYFEVSSYEEEAYLDQNGKNKFCSDTSIMQLLRIKMGQYNYPKNFADSSQFVLYKNIHYPPELRNLKYKEQQFGVVKEDELIIIDTNNIKRVTFINVKQNQRDWLQSELLLLPKGLVDSINFSNHISSCYLPLTINGKPDMSGYFFFSFDQQINDNMLKEIALSYHDKLFELELNYNNYIKKFTTWINEKEYRVDIEELDKFRQEKRKIILELIKELHSKKIIPINVWSTC